MRYARWTIFAVFWLFVAGWLHYTLPQHDVVRIVNTYEENTNVSGWTRMFWSTPADQAVTETTRFVQFIQAVRPNGDVEVYRNEDTGWSWPPYFKFDTANLYAEANDLVSTKEIPKWTVVTHYGWRNEVLSIFPNAIAVRPVDNPDVRIIPWFNIGLLAVLFAIFWAIRVRWLRFRARRIDPVLEDVGEAFDAAGDQISDTRSWLARQFGRK